MPVMMMAPVVVGAASPVDQSALSTGMFPPSSTAKVPSRMSMPAVVCAVMRAPFYGVRSAGSVPPAGEGGGRFRPVSVDADLERVAVQDARAAGELRAQAALTVTAVRLVTPP
ncbi:hypothetical protein [Streptomyces uncialis]|uniref:hypothetical protein n=1 Tax=Streptomyces uncialis TaxID=1048205 RepID=UPI003869B09F|nr:hypothetical protein OG924_29170 [Streptomyces uncialis]